MYDNANQGAYQNNGSPRKEIINQWQGVGVLRAKSTDPNAPLRFYSKDGVTGVLHAKIVVTQNSRNKDQNGDAIITKDETTELGCLSKLETAERILDAALKLK